MCFFCLHLPEAVSGQNQKRRREIGGNRNLKFDSICCKTVDNVCLHMKISLSTLWVYSCWHIRPRTQADRPHFIDACLKETLEFK